MNKKSAEETPSSPALRRRAEKRLKSQATDVSLMEKAEVRKLVHELEVHQIELEIQNEELRQTQVELAQARDRYLDLYDFAPVGYLTVDNLRVIREANLTAAGMLGVERRKLVGTRLEKLLSEESRDDCYRHFRDAASSTKKEIFEAEFQGPDGSSFYGQLEIMRVKAGETETPAFRVILSDKTERRAAEEALRESEENFRDLYEIAPNAYFSVGVDGRVLMCNRRAGELLGYPPEELPGKDVLDLYADTPQGKEKAVGVLEHFRAGEVVDNADLQMRKADGTPVWVNLSMNPLLDSQGQVVASRSIVVDMTARMEAVGALRESEEGLNQAQDKLKESNRTLEERVKVRTKELEASREDALFRTESIPHMVFSILRDGSFNYCNQRMLDYLGKKMEDLQEMRWTEMVHPQDVERSVREWNNALEKGKEVQDEFRARRAVDGEYRWHIGHMVPRRDGEGKLDSFMGTCTDIQERKKAEASLMRMSKVFQEAAVPIFIENYEGRIIDLNAEAERVFGWSPAELANQSLGSLVPEDRLVSVIEAMGECLEGRSIRNLESQWKSKKGNRIPVLLTFSRLSDDRGEQIGVAVIAKDISVLKEVESSLLDRERELNTNRKSLEDKNIALREVIAQIEVEKNQIHEDVATNIHEMVFPTLERVSRTVENGKYLDMIRKFLNELASPFGSKFTEAAVMLSVKEKEICRMIRGGLSSKEIAGMLAISYQTVEKHRKNIRRKLGITSTGVNLGSYLDTL